MVRAVLRPLKPVLTKEGKTRSRPKNRFQYLGLQFGFCPAVSSPELLKEAGQALGCVWWPGGEFSVLNKESCLATAHLCFHCCSTEGGCDPKSRSLFASCSYSNKCWKQLKWLLQTAVCPFISGVILPWWMGKVACTLEGLGLKKHIR